MRQLLTWIVCAVLSINAPIGGTQQLVAVVAGPDASTKACDCADAALPCCGENAGFGDPACTTHCAVPAVLASASETTRPRPAAVLLNPRDDIAWPQSAGALPFRPPRPTRQS